MAQFWRRAGRFWRTRRGRPHRVSGLWWITAVCELPCADRIREPEHQQSPGRVSAVSVNRRGCRVPSRYTRDPDRLTAPIAIAYTAVQCKHPQNTSLWCRVWRGVDARSGVTRPASRPRSAPTSRPVQVTLQVTLRQAQQWLLSSGWPRKARPKVEWQRHAPGSGMMPDHNTNGFSTVLAASSPLSASASAGRRDGVGRR